MAERKNPMRKIQLIVRPSPRKLKILFILLILACLTALGALGAVHHRIRQQTQAALDQAAVLEQDNKELTEKKEALGTSSSIRDIAREELDLVDPDTIIIEPNS